MPDKPKESTKAEDQEPIEEVAHAVDQPATATLEAIEKAEEIAKEQINPEPVIEEVEAQKPPVPAPVLGYDQIVARFDQLENLITSKFVPAQSAQPTEPKTESIEKKVEDQSHGQTQEKSGTNKRRKLKIKFRHGSK